MIYKGKVVSLNAAGAESIVRVVVPQVTGSRTQTARVTPMIELSVGDPVWVAYESGDFSQPVIISGLKAGSATTATTATTAITATTATTATTAWKRWSGTQAQYDAISPKDSTTLYVVIPG